MRFKFVGGENASLGQALRALAAARGWGAEEAERVLADFAPATGRTGVTSVDPRSGEPRSAAGREDPDLVRLRDFLRSRPEYRAARERLREAAIGQRIILFGDYDADGITSLAQLHRFLAAAGYAPSWFVPDRMRHGYGLTRAAADDCLAMCRESWSRPPETASGAHKRGGRRRRGNSAESPEPPILLIALDCGSTSVDVIAKLGAQGIDCIVVDHHQPPDPGGVAHPSAAHLNPHAWDGSDPDLHALRLLSAAGLAYCLCDALAVDLEVAHWDGAAGLVLAGLGTVADVVPLTGPNRRLVQAALRYANEKGFLAARLPGLARLHQVSGGGPVDARTFGYRWGPRLNAPGRIEDARGPAELLLAQDRGRIDELATACERANDDRKARTAEVLDAALALVRQRRDSGAQDRVLVLWDASWEPGIVGIVAGRLCEQLQIPAILFGKHPGQSVWKGSGRSVGDYDLGAEVRRAVEAGLAIQGGGHRQAAGLTVADSLVAAIGPTDGTGRRDPSVPAERSAGDAAPGAESSRRSEPGVDSDASALGLGRLRDWLNERCTTDGVDLEPVHEVLATVYTAEAWDRAGQAFRDPGALVRFWCDLYDRLEPFGAGNPRPGLLLPNAELVDRQEKTTWKGVRSAGGSEGSASAPKPRVWALSARFRWNGVNSLVADWTDPEAAQAVWAEPELAGSGSTQGVRYDVILEPHRSSPARPEGQASRTWYDWRVVACARRDPER